MKKGASYNKKGFTIVEVSLVLGVAGLIFLMVFLALPALQRGERDAERKEDMTMFLDAVKKYQKNNRGALPSGEGLFDYNSESSVSTSWALFYKNYLGDDFADPDGDNYTLNVATCNGNLNDVCGSYSAPSPDSYEMMVMTGAVCSDADESLNMPIKSSNPRRIAVIYSLEVTGPYCQSS